MFKEYAVDPEILGRTGAAWVLLDNMGVEHGRLISKFPKRWTRLVYDEIVKSHCSEMQKKKLEERLNRAKKALANLRDNRHYEADSRWLNAAIKANQVDPFAAILVQETPACPKTSDNLVEVDEATNSHPLWNNDSAPIKRATQEIVGCLAPLARISKEWLFIDPYLSDSRKRLDVVFGTIAASLTATRQPRRIEIHTSNKICDFESLVERVEARCERQGLKTNVVIYQWRPKPGGEGFHARYFLTERGGVHIDYGLSEGDDGQTTDMSRLNATTHLIRWKEFNEGTSTYEKIYMHEINS